MTVGELREALKDKPSHLEVWVEVLGVEESYLQLEEATTVWINPNKEELIISNKDSTFDSLEPKEG